MTAEEEDSFRRIVSAANEWRSKLASGAVAGEDREAFERWLAQDSRHEEVYNQAVAYWRAYGHLRADDIDADLTRPSRAERMTAFFDAARGLWRMPRIAAFASAAAMVLAVISAVYFIAFREAPQTARAPAAMAAYETGAGEMRDLTLADGTRVTLGVGSAIETVMSDAKRIVRLRGGAAMFETAHDADRPFIVETGALTARALGTAFEVRNNGGVARVAVAEGRVAVAYPLMVGGRAAGMAARAVLEAGQQIAATENGGLRSVAAIEPARVGAWRNALLTYDGATLRELIADADRHDDRDIILDPVPDDLASRQITVSFPSSDVDAMLDLLVQSYGVVIDRSDPGAVRIAAPSGGSE